MALRIHQYLSVGLALSRTVEDARVSPWKAVRNDQDKVEVASRW